MSILVKQRGETNRNDEVAPGETELSLFGSFHRDYLPFSAFLFSVFANIVTLVVIIARVRGYPGRFSLRDLFF